MNDSDDQSIQNGLMPLQTNGTWECIACLSNSFQRVRVLAVLNDVPADLRELKDALDIPRTSLQRNLALLEQHGWIKRVHPGYTTTTKGSLLTNVFLEMLGRVQRIESLTPFLAEVDLSTAFDIDRLDAFLVTVPEPHRPHAPMIRLLDLFETAEQMRAFSPVVGGLLAKRYCQPGEITGEYEFILSKHTVDDLRRPETDNWSGEIEPEQTTRIDLWVYDGEFPYGLFICEDTLVLAAYDGAGRIQAVVESESETTIRWGKQLYETYRHQSRRL